MRRKTGPKPRPPLDRFMNKVQLALPAGCWIWMGALNQQGYGNFFGGGKTVRAHRWAYEHFRGAIPARYDLDHLCRMPACVNPYHLEAVTHQENVDRGLAAAQDACGRGHPFTPENTYVRLDTGIRQCRVCRAAAMRRARVRARLARTEAR